MGSAEVSASGNFRGYEESSLVPLVGSLGNASVLLAHGTADTVSLQGHTLRFANELIRQEVFFSQLSYADERHRLDSRHLYQSVFIHLQKCLPKIVIEE